MLQVRLRLGEVVKRLVVHGLSYSCVFSIILVRTYIKAQSLNYIDPLRIPLHSLVVENGLLTASNESHGGDRGIGSTFTSVFFLPAYVHHNNDNDDLDRNIYYETYPVPSIYAQTWNTRYLPLLHPIYRACFQLLSQSIELH